MAEVDPEDARAAVRVLRALHGWSQAELAERAGLEVSSVQRYEAGRPVPPETLGQLSQAAEVPEAVLHTLLLPTLHFILDGIRAGTAPDPGLKAREVVEREAARAGEAAAAAARGGFLRAWADHVRQALEHGAGAWRPRPEQREEALDLWQRLEPLTPDEREVLLKHGTAFHSWALAERIADLAVDLRANDPARAVELADLALQVANRVPGSEAWKARVRAYALAALSGALRAAGEIEAAREVGTEAVRLWSAGAAESDWLSEKRFHGAMGA